MAREMSDYPGALDTFVNQATDFNPGDAVPSTDFEKMMDAIVQIQTVLGINPTTRQYNNLLINGSFESWSAGTAVAPDGYTLIGAGAAVAREATIIQFGEYSAKVTRNGANASLSQIPITPIDADTNTYWRGRTVTFGCWVYATVADRSKVYLSDGIAEVSSAFHPGDSAWHFLTVTQTLNAAATQIQAFGQVRDGDTAVYFDGAILVEGTIAPTSAPHHTDGIPCFNAYPAAAQTNIAINSDVTVVWGTEKYDLGDNFATNAFTAPRDGIYHFDVFLRIETVDQAAGVWYQPKLVTSNKTYVGATLDTTQFAGDLAFWPLPFSVDADMQVGDTATIALHQNGGTQQTDISTDSWFTGHLVGLF